MKARFILIGYITIAGLAIESCEKKEAPADKPDQGLISAAEQYVNTSVLMQHEMRAPGNVRASQPKAILWNQAVVLNLSFGRAVIAPVRFDSSLYVKTAPGGNMLLDLSQMTKLVVFTDTAGHLSYQVNTFVPDSLFIGGAPFFSGVILTEDWFGNSLRQATVLRARNPGEKAADELAVIQSCETIDGYNYSADDPDDGEAWSETTCTTYGVEVADGGVGMGPGDAATAAGGGGSGLGSFTVPPPTNLIANYPDYIKCFTNVGGNDHSYTVMLAVEQPTPGTRTPWVSNGGGGTMGGNPVNVGHTYLVMTETTASGSTTRNVGFYPLRSISPAYPSSQGALNDDEATGYNIELTITMTNAQFFTILNFLSQGNTSGYLYDLNTNNCTTFALNALASAGINIPTTKGTWLGGSGDDPGDLGEDIRGMQLPSNITRNTVSNFHPNVGSCQ
jgi:hypothetical protein